jgi:predicted phage gp36 major capsid-like protein
VIRTASGERQIPVAATKGTASWVKEEAFFVGDGSKKPTGILADTGGAPVAKTTASATAVTFDEVLDLLYSLKTPYRAKASFVTNDSTMKMLRKLKDSNGQYLWQPSTSIQAYAASKGLDLPYHRKPLRQALQFTPEIR